MQRLTLMVAAFALTASPAFATWSIVAVDQSTGTVAIASATCVAERSFALFPAKGLMDIQAVVAPGHGIAAAQAGVDSTRENQELIFEELEKGTAPDRIVEMLKADPNIENRQFGIVDVQGRAAGFSGQKNGPVSLSRQDRVPGTGIYFSIQGNILASEDVVLAAIVAFKNAKGSLTDRVMAAMEAADARGGDKRCTCDTQPKPNAPCETKTAQVAYILRAEPTDKNGQSVNDGHYSLYLAVTDEDITPKENANPVKTLRTRYDALMKARSR